MKKKKCQSTSDVCVPVCNLPKSFFISVYIYVRFAISLSNLKILSISITSVENKMKVLLRQILNLIKKKHNTWKIIQLYRIYLIFIKYHRIKIQIHLYEHGLSEYLESDSKFVTYQLCGNKKVNQSSCALFFSNVRWLWQSTTDNPPCSRGRKLFLKAPDCLS